MKMGFLLFLAVLAATAAGPATDIPWSRIPDADSLTAAQRQVMETTLRTVPCYGPCRGSILDCLERGDLFGARLSNFVARRAAENKPVDIIRKEIENRRLSAFPTDSCRVDLSSLVPAGNPNAPIRVVIFADFDCPFCKTAAVALRELNRSTPDTFSFWFNNFPLAQDERANAAAIAYLAAEKQGKGWPMFDMLFGNEGGLSDAALESCADGAGLDMAQYHADIKDPALKRRVLAEKAEGVACGFTRVPGILIDGKPYHGIKTKRELLDRIEEEEDIVALHRAAPKG